MVEKTYKTGGTKKEMKLPKIVIVRYEDKRCVFVQMPKNSRIRKLTRAMAVLSGHGKSAK
jgi:hypothetical protein